MGKRHKGRPIVALRLAPELIEALKTCAKQHGQTVSELLRQLIVEQLQRDGINPTSKPIDGQISM